MPVRLGRESRDTGAPTRDSRQDSRRIGVFGVARRLL